MNTIRAKESGHVFMLICETTFRLRGLTTLIRENDDDDDDNRDAF